MFYFPFVCNHTAWFNNIIFNNGPLYYFKTNGSNRAHLSCCAMQPMCLVTDQIVSWEQHFTECPDTAMHIQLDTTVPLCPQTLLHPVYTDFLKLFKSAY